MKYALLALLFAASTACAQIKISELPAASTLTGTEATMVTQGGVSKKATITQINAYTLTSTGTLSGKTISGADNTLSNVAFSALTGLPTTLAGYGITDGLLAATAASTYATITNLNLKAPIDSPTFTGTVTGPTFVGALTGNASTVTTNANLTGPVTSTGNATAIANGAISNAMLANGAVANLSGTNTGDQDLTGYMTKAVYDSRALGFITGHNGEALGATGGVLNFDGGVSSPEMPGGTAGSINLNGGNGNETLAGGNGGNIEAIGVSGFSAGSLIMTPSTELDAGSISTAAGGSLIMGSGTLQGGGVNGTILTTAGNGSGLTALNASELTSGTVAAARMPALTGDVTTTAGSLTTTITTGAVGPTQLASTAVTPGSYTATNLTVDADGRITAASNGSSGGGAVVKTGFYTKTDTATTTSTTFTTAYSATFTPTSASNSVVITASFMGAATNGYAVFLKITRGGTDISLGDTASPRIRCQTQYNGGNAFVTIPVTWQVRDSPSSTSALTYQVEWCIESGGTAYLNRSASDSTTITYGRGVATLKFEEVTP